jgi:hypothetical protein
VDWLWWSVKEQVSDITRSLLMLKDGPLAIEGEIPKAEAFAKDVARAGVSVFQCFGG